MTDLARQTSPHSTNDPLPLVALLSHALVAFTIEFDNEFERQMPHRTTNIPSPASRHDPWLVSSVMWSNCMRFVVDDGIRVRELKSVARTETNLPGMERWGYVVVTPDPADGRTKAPRSDWIVRATPAGVKAQRIWRSLFVAIEQRWEARFSKEAINRLRRALSTLADQLDPGLPDCLPILGYGLSHPAMSDKKGAGEPRGESSDDSLSSLLSRLLLTFAIEFERESRVSLAISANVLRILDEEGTRVRDLPRLTGVSKEAIAGAIAFLLKRRLAVTEPDRDGGRAKMVRLTAAGVVAKDDGQRLLGAIELRWQVQFGEDAIQRLRESLERVEGETITAPALLSGMAPPPGGWRASMPAASTLPHFPTVLHRGGFPDGS